MKIDNQDKQAFRKCLEDLKNNTTLLSTLNELIQKYWTFDVTVTYSPDGHRYLNFNYEDSLMFQIDFTNTELLSISDIYNDFEEEVIIEFMESFGYIKENEGPWIS